MVITTVVIRNEVGLHARPAALFVQTANKFAADIGVANLTAGGDVVDAKSILMVLTLGAVRNHELKIQAEGPDAEDAVQALSDLVLNDFAISGE
jgi:phosphotransferase system HPr (HPr) family protein